MTEDRIKVLLVEDNPGDALILVEMLREFDPWKFVVVHADMLGAGLARLEDEDFDVVLLDLSLPDSSGLETFTQAYAQKPTVPMVVLTGFDDEATALQAVKEGAQDYLVKGHVSGGLVGRSIRYAIERSRLLSAMEEQARKIERQKSRAEFLQIAAHELRNPMSIAKALTSLVRIQAEEGKEIPDLIRKMETVEREIDRVSQQLTEVLHAFQVQEGRLSLNRELVNLTSLVAATVNTYELSSENHGLHFNVRGLADVWVWGDSLRLEEVFRNLLSNAVKYSPGGGAIQVTVDVDCDRVLVSLRDEGLGIPEDQLAEVFEEFSRGRNLKDHAIHGLGLGLYICKDIIDRHDGRIWAVRNHDRGTTFHVELPCRFEHERSASAPRPAYGKV